MNNAQKRHNTLVRFIVLLLCLSMLLSIQCAFASEIKNASHRLHGASHKKGAVFPVASKAASKHSKQTGHSALKSSANSKITSNAFNFASMYQGSVDGRTGSYSFNATLGKVYGNAGFGPNYNVALHYSSSNPSNQGYGFGWSDSLSHYDKTTQMLQLSTGGSYKLTWSGTTPFIKYYKLDNLHLKTDTSGKYLFIAIHKDGTREYFNHFGYVVRLENTRGDNLYFHYVGTQNAGKLGSITDDSGKVRLSIDYTGAGLNVHSLQADGTFNTVTATILNAHLQNIVFADGKMRVVFHYMTVPHFPELISEIDYTSGAKEQLQYATLPIPTGGPVVHLYAVKTHYQEPGFGQPVIRTDYAYGLVNGHNYLGYASGVQYRKDVDNLYMRPDNYTYQTRVTHHNGASVVATYNKYHLLLNQKLYNPTAGKLVSELDYQYPNWLNSTIVSLPANYSLARKITAIAYDASPISKGLMSGDYPSKVQHSTEYQYDTQGNLLSKTAEDGTTTLTTYAPADANGFINYPKTQTVYPAKAPGTPAVLPHNITFTYITLPSRDKAASVGVTLPASTTLAYQTAQQQWVTSLITQPQYQRSLTSPDYAMPKTGALAYPAGSTKNSTKTTAYTHGQSLILWGKTYPVTIKDITLASAKGTKGPTSKVYSSINTGQTLMTIDALGNKTAYAYDALGRVTQVTAHYGASDAVSKQYQYTASASRNALMITAPNGYQTQQTYDGMGRVLATKVEHVDSNGKAVSTTWDTLSTQTYTANGKVASKIVYDTNESGTPQQQTTTNHYDILGKLVSQSLSNGHASVAGVDAVLHRSYAYPLFPVKGSISGTSLCTLDGIAHPCGVQHLQVKDKDARGDTVASYLFSLDPNITNDKGQALYSGGLKSALQSHLATDIAQGKGFDRAWLQTWLRQAIAAKAYYTHTTATYNAAHQPITQTDTDNHTTHFTYDDLGQMSRKTLPNGAIQTYHYDAMGNLVSVGNATGGTDTTLGKRQYNWLGQLVSSTDILGNTWSYHYNIAGELTDYTTPNGATINYSYDNRGNILTRGVTGNTEFTAHFTYDPLTNALLTRQDNTGTTTYTYAINGRLRRLAHSTLGASQGDATPGFTEQYRYTLSGKPTDITNAAGGKTSYHYDTQGRLTTVDYNGKSIARYGFDAAGRLITANKGPVTTTNTYNSLGQLSAYQTTVANSKAPQTVAAYQFTYAQDGDLRSRVRASQQGRTSEAYQYDSINNLLNYTCSGAFCPKDNLGNRINSQHYTFDTWNNIKTVATSVTSKTQGTQINTTTYAFDAKDPIRLSHYSNSNPAYAQSATLAYDKDGNITTNEHNQTVTYTPFDQMASINTNAGTVVYHYNGANVQVSETAPKQAPLYFEYGVGGLSALQQGGKTTTVLYGAGRIGEITPDGQQHYTVTDQSGSVLNEALVASNGNVTVSPDHTYTPYGIEGSETTRHPKAVSPLTQQNLWGFDGQLKDPASGYQFLGQGYHRAYNPVVRRFMSMDSISPFGKGGVNGYIFARNNPIMYGDPSGHMPQWLSWTMVGVGFLMAALATIATAGAASGSIAAMAGVTTGQTVALGVVAGGSAAASGLSTASIIEANQGHKAVAQGLGIAGGAVGIATMVVGVTAGLAAASAAFAAASTLGKVGVVVGNTLGVASAGTGGAAFATSLAAPNSQQAVDILVYVSLGTGLSALVAGGMTAGAGMTVSTETANIETANIETQTHTLPDATNSLVPETVSSNTMDLQRENANLREEIYHNNDRIRNLEAQAEQLVNENQTILQENDDLRTYEDQSTRVLRQLAHSAYETKDNSLLSMTKRISRVWKGELAHQSRALLAKAGKNAQAVLKSSGRGALVGTVTPIPGSQIGSMIASYAPFHEEWDPT